MEKADSDLVSVVVPIYNVRPYLDRCISSLVNQTYANIEIILIDDGSTDNSGTLCDEWSKRDGRIIVSHKTNGGLSDARNAGVEICHGEYIVFVDSDDYVDTEFIQKMHQSLVDSSSDMAMCSVIWEDENGKPLSNSPEAAFARDVVSGRACMGLTYSNPNAVTAWNKLYHRSLWNDLRFPKGKLHEDEFVFHEIMYQCDRVATLPDKLYHYVQHQGSIMHAKYNIRYLDRTDAWIQRLQSFIEHDEQPGIFIPLIQMIIDDLLLTAQLDWRNTDNRNAVAYRVERLFVLTKDFYGMIPLKMRQCLIWMHNYPQLAIKILYLRQRVMGKLHRIVKKVMG